MRVRVAVLAAAAQGQAGAQLAAVCRRGWGARGAAREEGSSGWRGPFCSGGPPLPAPLTHGGWQRAPLSRVPCAVCPLLCGHGSARRPGPSRALSLVGVQGARQDGPWLSFGALAQALGAALSPATALPATLPGNWGSPGALEEAGGVAVPQGRPQPRGTFQSPQHSPALVCPRWLL